MRFSVLGPSLREALRWCKASGPLIIRPDLDKDGAVTRRSPSMK